MIRKKYLEPPYELFGPNPQTSMYINSNTAVDFELTSFGTLCVDIDSAHGL
jgi:hypothetical protein